MWFLEYVILESSSRLLIPKKEREREGRKYGGEEEERGRWQGREKRKGERQRKKGKKEGRKLERNLNIHNFRKPLGHTTYSFAPLFSQSTLY